MIAPARVAAYRALVAIGRRGTDLPEALADTRSTLGDERDRALAAEIVTGTLRWQAALDYIVDALARRASVQTDVRVVLRLSAYQLLHLDRVPPSAVVHDAVELVRQVGHPRAAGFVNAVLRRVGSGSIPRLPPHPPADTEPGRSPSGSAREAALDYLSITESHPRWLVARWLDRMGLDRAARWTQFNNGHAPVTLRANTLVTTRDALADRLAAEGVCTTATRYAPEGLLVVSGNPFHTAAFEEGMFLAQDEASQLVALVPRVRPGDRVLDACAAPGGKTVALVAAAGPESRVVAMELRARRMALAAQTLGRARARNVHLLRADARQPLPLSVAFDVVLVDAPCSGVGTLRREVDLRWRRREGELPGLASQELAILTRAAEVVAPGGQLVYATCSSEPEENDAVVAAFLEHHRGFEATDPRRLGPVAPGLERVLDPAGRLRTEPDTHDLEAFFAALLVRVPQVAGSLVKPLGL